MSNSSLNLYFNVDLLLSNSLEKTIFVKIQIEMKFLLFLFSPIFIFAQSRRTPIDTIVVTQHETNILGKKISYTAKTGTQPLWSHDDIPIASIYYTLYERNDVKDKSTRPLIFSFNGGPGSASVWMHLGYTGPRLLKVDDEGYPVQPYGITDNPYSILDVADIVYINPVNTGYSRLVKNKEGEFPDRKQFFGINQDAKYLAEWMSTFVQRNNRWLSPKYLIGESYGGTRVMALAHTLQENQWMYLNGVIMVSPADYTVLRVGGAVSDGINLPYYTATAWYHKQLPPDLQSKDLTDILPEVERFTMDELIPAIAKGSSLDSTERERIAAQYARYSGLNKKYILQQNLVVPTSFFWKELLRDETGQTIGRLDSRYLGFDRVETGTRPDYNPELSSWVHSFTPAINHYIKNELNFTTDAKYMMFGDVHPWDLENDHVRENLRKAMAQNPYLKILIQSGYYDGATTYFQGKYTMWQIDPSGRMQDRMYFKGYRSGHMMYLRKEDLKQANQDIREFIEASASHGKPAKYE